MGAFNKKPIKNKYPPQRQAVVNVYKTRSQLLQEYLKNHNGPLTLKDSKFLNARVKIHQTRKKEANKIKKLIKIEPLVSVLKTKPKAAKKSKPKSANKAGPSKPKCTTPRCKALKMKNQKVY